MWMLARGAATFSVVLLIVFSLVGGLDVAGMYAFGVKQDIVATLPGLGIGIPRNIEWWGMPGAPQSLTMNLFYAPQHFFAALVGTALVVGFMQSARPAPMVLIDVLVVVAGSVFWSAYVAVGLAVLAFLKLIIDRGMLLRRLRQEGVAPLLTPWGLLAVAFAAALSLTAWVFMTAAAPLSRPRLLLDQLNALSWLLTYAINYAPHILALILINWPRAWKARRREVIEGFRGLRLTFVSCLTASGALLLLAHGTFNDWAMRTTLPLSIVLTVAFTQVLLAELKGAYLRSC